MQNGKTSPPIAFAELTQMAIKICTRCWSPPKDRNCLNCEYIAPRGHKRCYMCYLRIPASWKDCKSSKKPSSHGIIRAKCAQLHRTSFPLLCKSVEDQDSQLQENAQNASRKMRLLNAQLLRMKRYKRTNERRQCEKDGRPKLCKNVPSAQAETTLADAFIIQECPHILRSQARDSCFAVPACSLLC